MIDSLNQFASWIFTALTTIWNMMINNNVLKWFLAIPLITSLYKGFKKYISR